MPKKAPGPKAKALGAELRAIRQRCGVSMSAAGEPIGLSESLMSRLETGQRNIDPEEVSALLAIYGVTGSERDKLMAMARNPDEDSWLDLGLRGLPPGLAQLATYEADAVRIVDWALGLPPGLTQTPATTIAIMEAAGVPADEAAARLMARQKRQRVLETVEYTAFVDEAVLGRPIGGYKTLRGQLRRFIEIAEDRSATIRITPCNIDGHPGLLGSFMLLTAPDGSLRAHAEIPSSGVFCTGKDATQVYVDTLARLDSISLDVEESLRLLRQAAGAIESET